MAIWKKVIVSGSSAELAALKVDNLTSGSVVIGGGSVANLSATAINGTGNIVATTGATGVAMSGAFTGSFSGSAVLPALTQGTGVTSFSYNGSSAATVAVSGASTLNTNKISKWTGAAFADSSLTDDGTTISGATSIQLTGASSILTGSFSGSFIGALGQALSFVSGLSGSVSSYNGSAAVTLGISGAAALSTNLIPKWTGTGLANTNITDTGTQVQIGSGASSGLSVAAGGISVTGNSTFNSNLTVQGDLTVNGTASFVNSTNLYVKDQFILINSGSGTLADSGIITQYNAAGSGSALYLEAASAGTYGRWAMAYDIIGTSTSVTADEYIVSAKINQASNPSADPTWGGSANGEGNMWITNAGDIYIYA
jgi:hypothetical protein